MGPAANYRYFRQLVVHVVPIRVQIPLEPIQECFRVAGAPPRLVVKQHNGSVSIPAGAEQPHIAVALGRFARLMEHLQRGLIRVENLPLQQFFVQLVIQWGSACGRQRPHCCPPLWPSGLHRPPLLHGILRRLF